MEPNHRLRALIMALPIHDRDDAECYASLLRERQGMEG